MSHWESWQVRPLMGHDHDLEAMGLAQCGSKEEKQHKLVRLLAVQT